MPVYIKKIAKIYGKHALNHREFVSSLLGTSDRDVKIKISFYQKKLIYVHNI